MRTVISLRLLAAWAIIDTCASGGVLEISRQGHNPLAFRGAIESAGQRERVFTIAASSAGAEAQEIAELSHGVPILAAAAATEEAQDTAALKHGVLTYALLAGLRAVDTGPLERVWVQTSNPNQVVDVWEWFTFASGHVRRLTKQYCGSEQNVPIGGKSESFPVLPLQDH